MNYSCILLARALSMICCFCSFVNFFTMWFVSSEIQLKSISYGLSFHSAWQRSRIRTTSTSASEHFISLNFIFSNSFLHICLPFPMPLAKYPFHVTTLFLFTTTNVRRPRRFEVMEGVTPVIVPTNQEAAPEWSQSSI